MILYSVTVNVEDDIHEEWIKWMKEIHIPEVMGKGCFIENKMMKLLDPPQEGHTYSFQYFCETMDKLKEYQSNHAPSLQADLQNRYANKYAAFRTVLEVL